MRKAFPAGMLSLLVSALLALSPHAVCAHHEEHFAESTENVKAARSLLGSLPFLLSGEATLPEEPTDPDPVPVAAMGAGGAALAVYAAASLGPQEALAIRSGQPHPHRDELAAT
jgi:hypothetical protein